MLIIYYILYAIETISNYQYLFFVFCRFWFVAIKESCQHFFLWVSLYFKKGIEKFINFFDRFVADQWNKTEGYFLQIPPMALANYRDAFIIQIAIIWIKIKLHKKNTFKEFHFDLVMCLTDFLFKSKQSVINIYLLNRSSSRFWSS